jgi:predicted neuraminidase
MKTKLILLSIGLGLLVGCTALFSGGCTTAAQRTTYNTIATVEQTATAAVDGYFSLVIKGTVTTNAVPIVAKSFNDLQAAGKLAADASEAGTNALAPASLILEATDLGNLVQTIEATTKK